MDCKHPEFEANVTVNRLEDSNQFIAEIYINCSTCQKPFQFLGLPIGLHLNGAAMSADGKEARLAISPITNDSKEY
jgi:hypothetical protein